MAACPHGNMGDDDNDEDGRGRGKDRRPWQVVNLTTLHEEMGKLGIDSYMRKVPWYTST